MSVSFKDGCLQFSDDMQDVHRNYIGRQDIKEVILPVDLKSLQYYRDTTFGKSSVEKVTFREGTTKIPAYFFERFPDEDGEEYTPFYECDELKEVKLPSTLKKIGEYAFSYSPIEKIIIPDGVEEIEDSAFYSCDKLKEVDLPSTLKEISWDVFSRTGLTKVIIPEGVEKIDGNAFLYCDKLKEVKLPSTLKEIDEGAFAYCPNLKEVVVPKDTIIYPDAFDANCMIVRDDGQNLDPTLDFDDDIGDDDPGDIGD